MIEHSIQFHVSDLPLRSFYDKLYLDLNWSNCFVLQVAEIPGLFYIFAQDFFKDIKEKTGIDLENIVYFKDETHYFVMTAKKASLLKRGVLKEVLQVFHQ